MTLPARRSPAVVLVTLAACVLVACGGDGGGAGDDGSPAAGREEQIGDGSVVTRVFQRLEPSVVAVVVRGERGAGEGSGVVWSENVVVTNNHVVAGAREVELVLATGDRRAASVRATDPRTDLAVLDVEGDPLPAAEFAERQPPVGSLAVALGNPLGFENTVTAGVVSGLDRSIPSGGRTPALVGLLQTDAAISPGNSGGALAGPDGSVIGINVAYIPPQARAVSIGFAIPAPLVRDIVTQLLEDGRAEHPYLGIQLRPLTARVAEELGVGVERGVIVAAIVERGPADQAGLQPGDVIVQAGDRTVATIEDVTAALRSRQPGDDLTLEVARGGERRSVEVSLGERPRG